MKCKNPWAYIIGLMLSYPTIALCNSQVYLSAAAGKLQHDDSSITGTNISSTATDIESDVVSLSWGVANASARFLLEYYYQQADVPSMAVDFTKHGLFYSGYWTPYLFVPGLHGVLGAGIGATELRLDSNNAQIGEDFADREAQYKVTAGLEYRFNSSLAVKALYEHHFVDTYTHSTATNTIKYHDGNQSGFMVGIVGRWD